MIGHFLGTLSEAQEDKILTVQMRPGSYYKTIAAGPCLVGNTTGKGCNRKAIVVSGFPITGWGSVTRDKMLLDCIEVRYDALCKRYGVAKFNNMLRDRVLRNRAWRALHAPVEERELVCQSQ